MMWKKIPLETQTLYAELLEQLVALETHRSLGSLSGSFVSKAVKGETYYYFQYSDPGGGFRQLYIGKKQPLLDKVLKNFQQERTQFQADRENIQRLCAQLRAGGALMTDSASARVLKALADGGVFRLRGVLVGTHAFTVLGNLLGVRWEKAAIKTQDVDIAGEGILSLALPENQTDIPSLLEGLQMGFLPVPPLNAKNPSTSFKVRGQALRVDILTPETHPHQTKPIFLKRFNVAAQPLRYLDYLLEDPEKGAVVNGGGILVNVPSPARFALHKVMTSRERPAAFHTKTEKDLQQAAQIFSVLAEERPGDLESGWEALEKRGEGWIKKFLRGFSPLKKNFPEVYDQLKNILKIS